MIELSGSSLNFPNHELSINCWRSNLFEMGTDEEIYRPRWAHNVLHQRPDGKTVAQPPCWVRVSVRVRVETRIRVGLESYTLEDNKRPGQSDS